MTLAELAEQSNKKNKADFLYLMLAFQEVLQSLGEDELAEYLPWINQSRENTPESLGH